MFFMPDDDRKLETIQADAKIFVRTKKNKEQFDAVQVDLYDAICDGPAASSLDFYKGCFNILKEPGVMTVNLFSRHPSFQNRTIAMWWLWLLKVLDLRLNGRMLLNEPK
jgi:spermidine synthase